MSAITIEVTLCNTCRKEIDNPDKAIRLPKGDLDQHGIWFGDVGEYRWFDNESFCCFKCFIEYINSWHSTIANAPPVTK